MTRHTHPIAKDSSGNPLPSLTQQQFKQATDVNFIVANMQKGIMPPMSKYQPIYGDMVREEYVEMLNKTADIQNIFNRLPAAMRAQFQNRPEQFMRWLENPDNEQKAIKMGLLRERPKEPNYKAIMEGTDEPKDTPPQAPKADPEGQPPYGKPDKGDKKNGEKP